MAPPTSSPYGGGAFPDLKIVLQGKGITLVLDDKTHITEGITSSTFDTVPHAPFTTFDLELPQGRTSVFSAYGSLCKNALTMPATLTGQNGVSISQQTRISVAGCPKHRSHAVKKAREGK